MARKRLLHQVMRETRLATPLAQRYYSSLQIGVATLIGGPLAGGYLASCDHTFFGAPARGRATLIVSCIVIVASLYVGSRLPDEATRSVLPLLVAIAYRIYATYAFDSTIAQRKSEGWLQFSWWRTVGISLVFVAALLALAVVAVLLFRDS